MALKQLHLIRSLMERSHGEIIERPPLPCLLCGRDRVVVLSLSHGICIHRGFLASSGTWFELM